jgi:glycosyltransferase involved in cell wall biosynthesis
MPRIVDAMIARAPGDRGEGTWLLSLMACLLVEPWDFSQPLFGNGCAAVCDSAIRVLGPQLKLVGATSGAEVGRWTKTVQHGRDYSFFPVATTERLLNTKLLSGNLEFALAVAKHLGAIREAGISAVLTRTYTVLWLLVFFQRGWDVCFYYPGLTNPMRFGRRPRLGRFLAAPYEWVQALAIAKASVAFVPASSTVVQEYNRRLKRLGVQQQVRHLPTAVNLDLFRPLPRDHCRRQLGLSPSAPVFTFVGRLSGVKGIPLLIEALGCIRRHAPQATLLLVGDGELRGELEQHARQTGLNEAVKFLGRRPPSEVAVAVGCANVCVCGSYSEGFSNAMIEQVACGRPVVSTAVSGADELIQQGQNGFIVHSRDPDEFARRIMEAMRLPEAGRVSRRIAEERHSEHALWRTIAVHWPQFITGDGQEPCYRGSADEATGLG